MRMTQKAWKAAQYDSDEEKQMEDTQYDKELQNVVDTEGNAPPEWATNPEMQHMTRTTRAMARQGSAVTECLRGCNNPNSVCC